MSRPARDASVTHSSVAGFSITNEEMYNTVTTYIQSAAVTGWSNLSGVLGSLRSVPALRWASPLEVKNTVERVFVESFGPKGSTKPPPKVRGCLRVYRRV